MEPLWDASDFAESEAFPEAHGGFVGGDHEIELEGAKSHLLCLKKAIFAEFFPETLVSRVGSDHERGVRDVAPGAALIGDDFIEAGNTSLFFGYEAFYAFAEPVGVSVFVTGVRFKGVGVAAGDDFSENGEHLYEIIRGGRANHK